ncbi:enoyl-CoA hydratase/isomerase family protein [Acidianus sp. RZ1]|uniref:enoyl-CoA hydratase/isomerase family protein n=1 Tax=Acidianus sp. RZ1 TaxID=1540082 RepID=UPI0020A40507|nr:enoyl-CoA hydratase/isomerase family protein [Acidianus sp. RZ1]
MLKLLDVQNDQYNNLFLEKTKGIMGLLIDFRGNLAKVTFNSESKFNMWDVKTMKELLDFLGDVEKRREIKYVLFNGNNGNFGSGADIRELNVASKDREFASSFFGYMKDIYLKLISLDKITIGAVEGIAYGASLEMLLFLDFVIAHKDSKFAAPGGKIGVFPPALITVGPYIIGFQNVKKMAMLGEEISADQAKTIGLVTEVVENLDQGISYLLGKLSNFAPSSLVLMRKELSRYLVRDMEEAFTNLVIQVGSDNAREGINAFLARVKPSWASVSFSKS